MKTVKGNAIANFIIGISGRDCTILTHCTRLNCNFLATFDKHFKGLITSNLN